MPIAVAPEHYDFFAHNRFIEFENLIPSPDIELLKEAIDQVLSKRLKKIIDTRTAHELFCAGRDLFRDHPIIGRTTLSSRLAQIPSLLLHVKLVRLAYDQALRTTIVTSPSFLDSFSLQKASCIQPLLCGAIIRLTPDANPPALLPQKVGNVVFFYPDLELPWSAVFQSPHQSFLLIAYAPEKCRYTLTKEDPNTHALKKIGYGFGDALKGSSHPLLTP